MQKAWKGFVSQESIIKSISNASTIGLVEISTKSKKEKKALVKNLGKPETRGDELVIKNFLFDEISSKKVDRKG